MMAVSSDVKKNILTNPVTQFIETCPNATEDQLSALNKLHLEQLELDQQHKELQQRCKKISRQIGQAKRNGQATDKLLQSMQELSSDAKKLKVRLNNITENILSYFKCDAKPRESVSEKTAGFFLTLPPVRNYEKEVVSENQPSITLLTNEDDDWNRYVESNPDTSLYHRAEWKHLINNVFGHSCYYFYASRNREIVGILPLVRLKSKLFGDFMVSMPYFNSGGAIANSPAIEQALIREANKYAENIGTGHIEYRDNIARNELPSNTEKVNMVLPLPGSQSALWDSFTAKLRSQIRRAQREETQISIGREECLEDFYTVFAQNMRDLGTPVYAKSFFSAILKSFSQQSKIVVIRTGKRPVAAAFLLAHNETLEIPWASTIKQVNHLSINMLLYWEVLKFAIENRYRYFDFGRSSKDSGTFRFKQQWGAIPKQCYWHYWLPEKAELPKLNPNNPKYALAIKIWKKIPLCITKQLGPLIVKNLP